VVCEQPFASKKYMEVKQRWVLSTKVVELWRAKDSPLLFYYMQKVYDNDLECGVIHSRNKYNIFQREERQGHKLIFEQLQYVMDDINYLT
jgi:hypothetical protein